jgi:transposase
LAFRSIAPCVIAIQACATAHYWARGLTALGHQVRLVPPSYVKAYVKLVGPANYKKRERDSSPDQVR